MGSLAIPESGAVYADSQVLIYSIEKIDPYSEILLALWEASEDGQITVVTSELAVLEVLTVPIRNGDQKLIDAYEQLLNRQDMHLIPIDQDVLREAARLRAATSLKTPDAIHAATSVLMNCESLITNDAAFGRVPGLPVQLLNEVLAE